MDSDQEGKLERQFQLKKFDWKNEKAFYIVMPWGSKGRFAEGVYWKRTPETAAIEKILQKTHFSHYYEMVECGEISYPCENCVWLSLELIETRCTPSGKVDWTYLEPQQVPTEREIAYLLSDEAADLRSWDGFDNMTFTKMVTRTQVSSAASAASPTFKSEKEKEKSKDKVQDKGKDKSKDKEKRNKKRKVKECV